MIILQLTKDELRAEFRAAVQEVMSSAPSVEKDRLLSREESATFLKVSLPTLLEWEKLGHIKGKRYGKRVYYFESDLMKKPIK